MSKTKIVKNINHGIVFWITGFPGSGKTKISSLLHKKIENLPKICQICTYPQKN